MTGRSVTSDSFDGEVLAKHCCAWEETAEVRDRFAVNGVKLKDCCSFIDLVGALNLAHCALDDNLFVYLGDDELIHDLSCIV